MRRLSVFLALLCVIGIYAFTQEYGNDQNGLINETVYIINSFNFKVDGITRKFALITAGELVVGEEITGLENLEKYIKDKTQVLYNQRVIESVSIEYTIGDIYEDGKYPVDLLIKIKDTWNIIAIPRPQYSSNTGFDLTIKARDYNFFGTMSPLRFDLGYQYDEQERTFFNLMTDSNTPFKLFDFTWYIRLYNYLEYRPDMSEPWHYKNNIGLSWDIPIGNTTLNIGFYESFILNEANSESNIEAYGLEEIQEGIYMTSRPFISWRIPTGLEIGKWGEITYTPNLSVTFIHEFEQWPLDITRTGPNLSFSQSLSFGRVDWIGNFLNGLRFNASYPVSYNFYDNSSSSSIRLTGIAHHNFENHFSISGRLMYRHYFNSENDSAGDALRGILDKEVKADIIFSLNLDLSLSLMHFRPSTWFNRSKLRIFNFDFHLNPFFDAAIYRSAEVEAKLSGADFTYKNLLLSSGFEVIIFPLSFRSLFLRASLGFNMSTLTGLSSREIYIGTELHYQ